MTNPKSLFELLLLFFILHLSGLHISFNSNYILNLHRVDLFAAEADKTESIAASLKNGIKETTGLEVSGFFDVYASNYNNNPNIFEIGNFELDLEHSFAQYFQVASALVFNTDGAELAVAFIDFHLRGGSIAPRGRLFKEQGVHLQVGKFDLPFGNDWQYFASPDRLQVSAPLTTEYVNSEGYNDTGLRILGQFVSLNFTTYIIKGIEEGVSFGGRIGLTPLNNPFMLKEQEIPLLELGFSYIYDGSKSLKREQTSLAIDMGSKIEPIALQWEYSMRDTESEILTIDGTHVSISYDAILIYEIPLIPFIRYDVLRHRSNEMHNMFTTSGSISDRLSGGFNINILDITTFKLEYQQYIRSSSELKAETSYSEWSIYGQLVISF